MTDSRHEMDDELISAYLDGELSDSERQQVERELAENARYRRLCDDLRSLQENLQLLPVHRLGEDFCDKVLNQIRARAAESKDEDAGGAPCDSAARLPRWPDVWAVEEVATLRVGRSGRGRGAAVDAAPPNQPQPRIAQQPVAPPSGAPPASGSPVAAEIHAAERQRASAHQEPASSLSRASSPRGRLHQPSDSPAATPDLAIIGDAQGVNAEDAKTTRADTVAETMGAETTVAETMGAVAAGAVTKRADTTDADTTDAPTAVAKSARLPAAEARTAEVESAPEQATEERYPNLADGQRRGGAVAPGQGGRGGRQAPVAQPELAAQPAPAAPDELSGITRDSISAELITSAVQQTGAQYVVNVAVAQPAEGDKAFDRFLASNSIRLQNSPAAAGLQRAAPVVVRQESVQLGRSLQVPQDHALRIDLSQWSAQHATGGGPQMVLVNATDSQVQAMVNELTNRRVEFPQVEVYEVTGNDSATAGPDVAEEQIGRAFLREATPSTAQPGDSAAPAASASHAAAAQKPLEQPAPQPDAADDASPEQDGVSPEQIVQEVTREKDKELGYGYVDRELLEQKAGAAPPSGRGSSDQGELADQTVRAKAGYDPAGPQSILKARARQQSAENWAARELGRGDQTPRFRRVPAADQLQRPATNERLAEQMDQAARQSVQALFVLSPSPVTASETVAEPANGAAQQPQVPAGPGPSP